MSDRPTLLLEHHLKELKLPTFLREYGKIAAQCASEGVDHPDYLLRLSELELHRPPPPPGGAQDQGSALPCRQEPGRLRLPGHTVGEQAARGAARALRVHRASRERHRYRQQRDRQDAHRAGTRTRRLPEGTDGGLHHRIRPW